VPLDPGAAERLVCYLETIGRSSGLPRDPSVRVRFGNRWFSGSAVDMAGDPDEIMARQLVGGKYG
jgi:hypothetical protein